MRSKIQTETLPSAVAHDPRERARYAWESFSAAMREITADAPGWRDIGGDQIRFSEAEAFRPWARVCRIRLDPMFPNHLHRRGLEERDEEFEL